MDHDEVSKQVNAVAVNQKFGGREPKGHGMVDDSILTVQVNLDFEFVKRSKIPKQLIGVKTQARVHVQGTKTDQLPLKF